MNLKKNKITLLFISVFAFLLLFSTAFYIINGSRTIRRVLFFPGRTNYSGEVRRLPLQASVEDDVELFVKELILGPFQIDHSRVVPENTNLKNLMIREKSLLYIDFSADFIVHEDEFTILPEEMKILIKKNIVYNFPFLKQISISVDGQSL
ncbi:MAG: GerMN domain-containing protein [Spirochaetales bacterium]|nr:GerMN domain-containing protein [Spirochaetales bacterium]